MRTLTIHAGMMKTGSTSIQVSLAKQPRGSDYRYLYHHSNNSSMPMWLAFKNTPPAVIFNPVFAQPGYRDQFLRHLAHELQQDSPAFIVSAEMISAHFAGQDYAAMRAWFARHVPDIRIVVYVREPGSFIESLYQQLVKEFGTTPPRPQALYPKFRQKFEAMEQAFGRENVVYRTFDPTRFVGGDIVLDFASVVGFEFNPARVVRANDSHSLSAMALLHAYHCHLPEGHAMRLQANPHKRRLLRLLSLVQGPKFRLDRRVVEPILQRQEADTAWIAERLDKPLPAYLAAEAGEGIRSVDDLPAVGAMALDWLGELGGSKLAANAGADIAQALGRLADEAGFEARITATRRYFGMAHE